VAWSRLQSNSGTAGSGNVSATYTTANLSSGSVLIAAVSLSSSQAGDVALSAVCTCADGSSNSLPFIGGVVNGTNGYTGLFAATTPAGDVGTKPTITGTFSGTIDNFGSSILIQEISGINASADGTYGSATGAASPATTGSYSSAGSNEYLVCAYGDPGFSVTLTTPGGYSADANNLTSSNSDVAIFYKNSTGGPESASVTLSGSANWGTVLVAFGLSGPVLTSGPALTQQYRARRPAMVVSNAGWRGSQHSR
jgi:hypothetical protein